MEKGEITRRTALGGLVGAAATSLAARPLLAARQGAGPREFAPLSAKSTGRVFEEGDRPAGIQAFIARVSAIAPVPVTEWHNEAAWGANLTPALLAAVDAIKTGKVPAGKVSIPYRSGGWELASETLLDASWAIYIISGDIKLMANTAQHGLRVTADGTTEAPKNYLENVAIIGDPNCTIDGNGDAMHFSEPAAGTAPDYSALRCVGVKNLYVRGVHAKNGLMNSMSVKRCPGHLIEDVEFSFSRYDNGFSATSDLGDYNEIKAETWGGGTVQRFKAHDNRDFGATAYNCSGQKFLQGECFRNDGGISYEHARGVRDGAKNFRGMIDEVSCYDNYVRGIYVDASGVTIGDGVETRANGNAATSARGGLSGFGVVVANVGEVYVGGNHHRNAKGGVLLTNDAGVPMQTTFAAKVNDNGWVGCYARAQALLHVLGQAQFNGNGVGYTNYGNKERAIFAGHGLYAATNSSGEAKMFEKGTVRIDGAQFSDNAFRPIHITGFKKAVLLGARGSNNFALKAAGASSAIKLEYLEVAEVDSVHMMNDNGRQKYLLEITSTVGVSYERGIKGDASVKLIGNSAAVAYSVPAGARPFPSS